MDGKRVDWFSILAVCWLVEHVVGATAATDAQAVSCASGWLYNPHHNTCVKAVNSIVSWFDARDACNEEESTLLHVDSDDMEGFIGGDIRNTGILPSGSAIWIASNDIVEEATLCSVFRSPISYTDWRTSIGQPNDANEDGGPHTQNCVMDTVSTSLHQQQDWNCYRQSCRYVCELWPRDMYTTVFDKTKLDVGMIQNYGLGSEADDIYRVTTPVACAALCLEKHFFCEVFLYSGKLQRCQLLRLYEQGHAKAFTAGQIPNLMAEGYEAFAMSAFAMSAFDM